jgi:cation diffusion facilitator CzcD-associated flavoprotein CzcO
LCLGIALRRAGIESFEILEYMEHCADKYRLHPHLRFGCEVQEARFDEVECVWRVRTSDGEERVAEVLVSGVGQLHRPSTPDFEGLESFAGPSFHSARWDHGLDLTGKRIGDSSGLSRSDNARSDNLQGDLS